jgi:hypothetical protein
VKRSDLEIEKVMKSIIVSGFSLQQNENLLILVTSKTYANNPKPGHYFLVKTESKNRL